MNTTHNINTTREEKSTRAGEGEEDAASRSIWTTPGTDVSMDHISNISEEEPSLGRRDEEDVDLLGASRMGGSVEENRTTHDQMNNDNDFLADLIGNPHIKD